jgi:hypothetical protein
MISLLQEKIAGADHRGRAVFARLSTGVVVLNTIRGMDVCVRLFYLLSCVGSGLAKG